MSSTNEGGSPDLHTRARRLLRGSWLWRPAAAVFRAVASRRGVVVNVDGVRLRFEYANTPVRSLPPVLEHVAFADYHMSRAFMRAISPGDFVADVGAHRGVYTVLAASRVGSSGRVFAFEPVDESRRSIAAVAAMNGFGDRVESVAAAVSDTEGTTTFFVSGTAAENSLYRSALPTAVAETAHATQMRTVTIDTYFATVGRPPAVMKIDTEGAEFAVLRGAERALASGARVICELHPYAWAAAGHTQADFESWLAARGRRIVDLRTGATRTDVIDYGPYLLEHV